MRLSTLTTLCLAACVGFAAARPPVVAGNVVGHPQEMDLADPATRDVLMHALAELNAHADAYHVAGTILRATKQLVAGIKYVIDFEALSTTCEQAPADENDPCQSQITGRHKLHAVIVHQPWQRTAHPEREWRVTLMPLQDEHTAPHDDTTRPAMDPKLPTVA